MRKIFINLKGDLLCNDVRHLWLNLVVNLYINLIYYFEKILQKFLMQLAAKFRRNFLRLSWKLTHEKNSQFEFCVNAHYLFLRIQVLL